MRLRFILPAVIFLGLAVVFAVGLTLDPGTLPSALIDKPAPEFDLPPIAGRTENAKPGFKTADLMGQVSLVNVFASWCIPCRAEHPILMRLAEEQVVPLFGINYKDKPEDATRWLAELGDPYTRIGADLDGRVGIEWGVYGVPETYIVDREGRVRYRHVSPITPKDLENKILPIIEGLRQ
ncbi:MAG: DsbE family thiol:disulfide interchange protein [Alphaproteobacteria bacterium]